MSDRVEIVPAHLAVQAMRDNGYKNAAYAVAELMDNSIQAGATIVELLCAERTELVNERYRARLDQLAVLDNGRGMNEAVLRMALQFGNGTNLLPGTQTGMGKFGMGLPSSSVSQARRVDVWTWQGGLESANHSYLDIDEISKRHMDEVPHPKRRPIPELWRAAGTAFEDTGTLVVWSKIDRCIWRAGKALIQNSELLIGRMYRKFLVQDRVSIRMASFDAEDPKGPAKFERDALPNDPLYLMVPSSTPEPYNAESMFDPWPSPDNFDILVVVRYRGADHTVHIRSSMAKKSARDSGTAGSRDYGRHAQRNLGVSVLRAGRELELDPAWAHPGDVRERWWGVEVEFPPALDEVFGVTNNKQHARNFAEMARFDVDELLVGGKTITQLKQEMYEEQDPRGPLLEIAHAVNRNIREMRKLIQAQLKHTRSREGRHAAGLLAEKEATEKTRERQKDGHAGVSDREEMKPHGERLQEIETALVQGGIDPSDAHSLAAATVGDSLKYVFAEAPKDTPAFFSVEPKGGALIITLNTEHPAYSRLVDVLEESPANASDQNLAERLNNALLGLKLLLMAWARYEDEQTSPGGRARVQDSRIDWGRIARRFLERTD